MNKTPSAQHHHHHHHHHHQHIIINQHVLTSTTSSTRHHQHNATLTQHHEHNTINTTPSTQHHQRNTINTSSSRHQHLEHLSLILRGRCSSWSTSREVRGSPANDGVLLTPAAFAWQVHQSHLRGRSEHIQTGPRKSGECFCVCGALGAPQSHFA